MYLIESTKHWLDRCEYSKVKRFGCIFFFFSVPSCKILQHACVHYFKWCQETFRKMYKLTDVIKCIRFNLLKMLIMLSCFWVICRYSICCTSSDCLMYEKTSSCIQDFIVMQCSCAFLTAVLKKARLARFIPPLALRLTHAPMQQSIFFFRCPFTLKEEEKNDLFLF